MSLIETLDLIQIISSGYKQINLIAVPEKMSREAIVKKYMLESCKYRKVGWVYRYDNGGQTISFHMPTEWNPGNNPIPEPFNSEEFKRDFL